MEQALVQLPLGRPHRVISHALPDGAEIKEVQILGEQDLRKFSDERTGAAGLIVKVPFDRYVDLHQAVQPADFTTRSFIVLPGSYPVIETFQYIGSYSVRRTALRSLGVPVIPSLRFFADLYDDRWSF